MLVLHHDRRFGDLNDLAQKEQLEAVFLEFILKRLLYPIFYAALFWIVVFPIAAKDRKRRVGTFFSQKQCRLARRVSAADYKGALFDPRICFAKVIIHFRQVLAGHVQFSRMIHRPDREKNILCLIFSLVRHNVEMLRRLFLTAVTVSSVCTFSSLSRTNLT